MAKQKFATFEDKKLIKYLDKIIKKNDLISKKSQRYVSAISFTVFNDLNNDMC